MFLYPLIRGWLAHPCADMGVERCVNLDGMSEPQILKALEDLVKAGGAMKA